MSDGATPETSTEQPAETAGGNEGAQAPDTAADAVVVTREAFETLQSQVKALEDKKAALEADLHKARTAKNGAKEAQEQMTARIDELAKESADLKAKLEEVAPKAERYEEWAKAETEAIAARAKDLDSEQRAILDALPLSRQRAFLDVVQATPQKSRPPEHPAGTPADGGHEIDWTEAAATGRLSQVRAQHPEAWSRFVASSTGKPTSGNPLLGRLLGRR